MVISPAVELLKKRDRNIDRLAQYHRAWYREKCMFAVIKTGGKQYLVSLGMRLKIEKVDAAEGGSFSSEEILFVADGEKIDIGTPRVPGARVEAKVLRQGRARKVIVFKYRPKARHRVKKGHRQPYTEIQIEKILAPSP